MRTELIYTTRKGIINKNATHILVETKEEYNKRKDKEETIQFYKGFIVVFAFIAVVILCINDLIK